MAENPYRRLRELTKTSQRDFAKKYGFAKTTMTYLESGQYPSISDDMIVALGQECSEKHVDAKAVLREEYNAETLADAYKSWQSGERMQVAYRFNRSPSGQHTAGLSPFHFMMVDIAGSRQAFCKLLKVPAASVLRYASGQTRSMPKSIEEALREVKYPYLRELLSMQVNWVDDVK
jgi:transcriptional regulator with XRE-family HTH domain